MNKRLDQIYFRYHIKTKEGIKEHDISLREYMRRNKENILIGISFKEYEWLNIEFPEIIIKSNIEK